MGFCRTLLRVILAAEALLLIPGLPAWSGFANASLATQSYLLCLGVFSAFAAATLLTDKPSCRIWAWATAVTNIPVPALAPVGLVLVLLLLALHLKPSRRPDWPARVGTWWPWFVGLGFCWGAAWNVHRFSQISGLPFTPALLLFGGLLVLMPSCVVVHQAGHWLAGRHSELAAVSSFDEACS